MKAARAAEQQRLEAKLGGGIQVDPVTGERRRMGNLMGSGTAAGEGLTHEEANTDAAKKKSVYDEVVFDVDLELMKDPVKKKSRDKKDEIVDVSVGADDV